MQNVGFLKTVVALGDFHGLQEIAGPFVSSHQARLLAQTPCPFLKENAFGVKVMLYSLTHISCDPNVSF